MCMLFISQFEMIVKRCYVLWFADDIREQLEALSASFAGAYNCRRTFVDMEDLLILITMQ